MENEKYILYYKVDQNINIIRILGEDFVKNNKNKGKIIYKNKIFPLQDYFVFENNLNNKLKIQMLLSKDCYNKSCMFKDCLSLIQIQFNSTIYNREDLTFNSENNLYTRFNRDKNIKNYNNTFNNEKGLF